MRVKMTRGHGHLLNSLQSFPQRDLQSHHDDVMVLNGLTIESPSASIGGDRHAVKDHKVRVGCKPQQIASKLAFPRRQREQRKVQLAWSCKIKGAGPIVKCNRACLLHGEFSETSRGIKFSKLVHTLPCQIRLCVRKEYGAAGREGGLGRRATAPNNERY